MNKQGLAVVALVVGVFVSLGGAAVKKASKISAFAGSSTGTVLLTATSGNASGPATGTFTASKKKEAGTLTLASTISNGAITEQVTETYQFNRGVLTYTLLDSGTSGTGSGGAAVGKNVITYSAALSFFGSPFTVQGTIRQSKKRLFVTETLTSSSTTVTFSYTLARRVHRK